MNKELVANAADAPGADELDPSLNEPAQGASGGEVKRARSGKGRIALIAGGITLFVAVMGYAVVMGRTSRASNPVVTVPTQELPNVPGDANATPAYDARQIAANAAAAQQASEEGKSHLPTLTGRDNKPVEEVKPVEPAKPVTMAPDPLTDTSAGVNERIRAIREFFSRFDGEERQDTRTASTVVYREVATETVASVASSSTATPSKSRGLTLAEGTTVVARVERTVDSDHPGPVHVVVVSDGPLKGLRMKGAATVEQNRVSLPFTMLIAPATGNTAAFSAKAYDLNNTSYGLATDVDYHIVERYGGLLLASLAKATPTLLAPKTVVTQQLANGVLSQQSDRASLGDIGRAVAADGLGQIGSDIASASRRPITIRVNQGEMIGVVLTAALELPPDMKARTDYGFE